MPLNIAVLKHEKGFPGRRDQESPRSFVARRGLGRVRFGSTTDCLLFFTEEIGLKPDPHLDLGLTNWQARLNAPIPVRLSVEREPCAFANNRCVTLRTDQAL